MAQRGGECGCEALRDTIGFFTLVSSAQAQARFPERLWERPLVNPLQVTGGL